MKFTKGSKEIVQFLMSTLVLIAGIALLFVGLFIQPAGIIHYTVLTATGMLLSFVGAVWNIDLKYDYKTKELKKQIGIEDDKEDGTNAL